MKDLAQLKGWSIYFVGIMLKRNGWNIIVSGTSFNDYVWIFRKGMDEVIIKTKQSTGIEVIDQIEYRKT